LVEKVLISGSIMSRVQLGRHEALAIIDSAGHQTRRVELVFSADWGDVDGCVPAAITVHDPEMAVQRIKPE
jgi:hypothetical protein